MRQVKKSFRFLRFLGIFIWYTTKIRFLYWKQRAPAPYHVLRKASTLLLECLNVDVTIDELGENLESTLIVSNHLGILDPLMLVSKLDISLAAKAEMEDWFIVGNVCRAAGTIFVKRDRKMAAAAFVDELVTTLDSGKNVLVFPEGTTSTGESILKLKTGSFEAITKLENRSIQPVCMQIQHVDGDKSFDGRTILTWADPNQSIFANLWRILEIQTAHVHIFVGETISVNNKDRKTLAQEAFDEMCSLLAKRAHR